MIVLDSMYSHLHLHMHMCIHTTQPTTDVSKEFMLSSHPLVVEANLDQGVRQGGRVEERGREAGGEVGRVEERGREAGGEVGRVEERGREDRGERQGGGR